MIKKIFVLATGALLSMNASAGYVQFTFTGGISGSLIQNDVTKVILDYNLQIGRDRFEPSGYFGGLSAASSSFWRETGPTNFTIYDRRSEVYISEAVVAFGGSYSNSPFSYTGHFSQSIDPGYPSWGAPLSPVSFALRGSVVASSLSAEQIAYYDTYGATGLNTLIPVQNVPEPTSIALLAAGALGVAAIRRRKAAR